MTEQVEGEAGERETLGQVTAGGGDRDEKKRLLQLHKHRNLSCKAVCTESSLINHTTIG